MERHGTRGWTGRAVSPPRLARTRGLAMVGLFAVLAVLLALRAARAEDGVIEINQVRALAGGITAEDAPGFPVTLASRGSYRLTSNLDVRGEPDPEDVTAIRVVRGAAFVSIDLNGFAILGPTTCPSPLSPCTPTGSGNGIRADLDSYVSVHNGEVRGMGQDGLSLASGAAVFDVRATNNGGCGICVHSGPALVVGCTAEANGGQGINIIGGIVRHSTARSGQAGIVVRPSSIVAHNSAVGNVLTGIVAGLVVAGSLLLDNTVYGNGTGILLEGPSGFADNVVTDNLATSLSGGIELDNNLCDGVTPCTP